MKIKQISLFLENKTGRINKMCHVLSDAGISMSAFSLAETAEFGIMRIIVSEVEKAVTVFKENGFTCSLTEVLCVDISDSAGALDRMLDDLSAQDIFIDYMYAFSSGTQARVILRPSDLEKCLSILSDNKHKLVSSSDFLQQ